MKIGMDHNVGLTDDQDIAEYLKRDLAKRSTDIPYKIVRDEIVGRHMVAARDIKPGEIILVEAPLTFGPLDTSKPICLGCYKPVSINSPKCSGCNFPFCSEACSQVDQHKLFECQVFQKHGFKVDSSKFNYLDSEDAYAVISPIRALLLKEKDPIAWNLLWMQMSHDEARRKSDYWKARTQKIINFLRSSLSMTEEDLRTVEILLGIFLVNDFELNQYDRSQELVSSSSTSIRAIFGLASMPNHSCVANTTHDFASCEKGFLMTVKAVVSIKKGDDITHSYTEPLDNVLTRRSILKMGKFFQCCCIRCDDPTEMGTFSSAILCSKCQKGIVLTSDVKNIEAKWKCNNCNNEVDCNSVQKIVSDIKVEGDKIEPSETYSPTIEQFENFLEKYSKILHQNHVVLIDKKYTLAKMYGRMKGFEPDEMSDEQFQRKKDLCQQVLKVLDKIMPGRSRKRGMMMYELHLPLVMLANRALQRGPGSGANPEQIKADLKSGLFNLRMGLEILKDEPEDTFERKIVDGSKESVDQLEQWVKTVSDSI